MGSRSKSSVAQASVSRSTSLSEKKEAGGACWREEDWTMAVQGDQMVLMLLLLGCAMIEATQKVNTTEIRLESGSGLKNYEEEEGTVLPYRTFLTTVEIIIICVVTVIVFVLTVLLVIYLCVYGCVLPECCKRKNKEYTPVMLERERKTTEIWKQNHTRASGGVQKLDSAA